MPRYSCNTVKYPDTVEIPARFIPCDVLDGDGVLVDRQIEMLDTDTGLVVAQAVFPDGQTQYDWDKGETVTVSFFAKPPLTIIPRVTAVSGCAIVDQDGRPFALTNVRDGTELRYDAGRGQWVVQDEDEPAPEWGESRAAQVVKYLMDVKQIQDGSAELLWSFAATNSAGQVVDPPPTFTEKEVLALDAVADIENAGDGKVRVSPVGTRTGPAKTLRPLTPVTVEASYDFDGLTFNVVPTEENPVVVEWRPDGTTTRLPPDGCDGMRSRDDHAIWSRLMQESQARMAEVMKGILARRSAPPDDGDTPFVIQEKS